MKCLCRFACCLAATEISRHYLVVDTKKILSTDKEVTDEGKAACIITLLNMGVFVSVTEHTREKTFTNCKRNFSH